ncbi:hypothetical protein [Balneicella halophila]|uniref:hypothetical protein n=1 Tax=Balneicella halophila TaxID=1537566 RepID=UPI0026A29EB2
MWVFFDIKRRRPTQILSQVKERWSICKDESIQCNIYKKIKPVVTPDFHLRYKVNRFDTDTNKHVNNIRYLQWVLESIPDEIIDNYYMFSIDGRFISEATYGQTVISMTQMLHKEDSEDKSFLHTVKVENTGLVCATAQTVWRKLKN